MDKLRSRTFVFTINNYTQQDIDTFTTDNFRKQVRYYIYGFETGEKEETPHMQGFIIFHNQKTFLQLKKILPRAHLEKTKGNTEQNTAYCSKDGDYQEYGTPPKPQGKRTDLEVIKQKVLSNTPLQDIIPIIQDYQQLKFMEGLMKYQKPTECKKKNILWYYGGTGSGKTRQAIKQGGDDYYISMNNLRWWDGYYGQKVVILDDFRKDFCTFHELLRILDRYPYRVQIKGSSLWLQAETIIITSCFRPEDVYETREDVKQLLRRIDRVVEFK